MPPNDYRIVSASLLLAVAAPALAQQTASQASLGDCARIADSASRLTCFDRLAAGTPVNQPMPAPPAAAPVAPPAVATPGQALALDEADTFTLTNHWELDAKHRRGVFRFRPHRPNYLIATWTASPNNAPYRPFRQLIDDNQLSHAELVFQLGFKMKLIETAFEKPVDLWFGYTQNSFWQASNHKASSPFRETDYQPEIMAVTPLHFNVLGLDARFLSLGVAHQSNGQASTLSRSWNRVYAQVGLERGRFSLTGRVWKRLNEPAAEDNNPDIVDYMGRGDLTAAYRSEGGYEYSALLRHNFQTGRSAAQLGFAFPLVGPLKGYVQVFSGYGQSLIDYNYLHRTVGIGVMTNF
jgi:phospholipase A1